jgi:hypothetical protein
MFISFLYMFRATMYPSSGEITVSMRHLVFVILYGCLSGMHTRDRHPYRMTNTKCRIDSYFSWWWAHSRPKHAEKRNKNNKKNCVPNWLYLQDPLIHLNPSMVSLFYFTPIRLHTSVTLWKCPIQYLLAIWYHLTAISDSYALSTKETRTTLTCV